METEQVVEKAAAPRKETQKTEKALVKAPETAVAAFNQEGLYGAGDDITANDITIGRLVVMQATSDLVKQDKAKQGAIMNLLDNKEVGYKEEKPLLFIPIKSFKYWIEKDLDTKEFIGRSPALDANEKQWEEMVDGRRIGRMYHHSFYVLLPDEIKNMEEMPLELSFRSTDLVTARKLSAFLLKLRKRGEPSWNRVFKLTTQYKQKDKYSWFGTDVAVGDPTPEDYRKNCYEWYKQVSSGVKLVHQDVEEAIVADTSDIPF